MSIKMHNLIYNRLSYNWKIKLIRKSNIKKNLIFYLKRIIRNLRINQNLKNKWKLIRKNNQINRIKQINIKINKINKFKH